MKTSNCAESWYAVAGFRGDDIDLFTVTAVDEFDRKFQACYAVPADIVILSKVNYIDWIYEKLVHDILVIMGTGAWAEWEGEIRVIESV